LIGEVWTALVPYYDNKTGRKSFKGRPVLIIAKADAQDYVALPISKVSRRENVDPTYDIEVDPSKYPVLGFPYLSYVRTHKQMIVHVAELGNKKSDLKSSYEELYLEILAKREQFSEEITRQATI